MQQALTTSYVPRTDGDWEEFLDEPPVMPVMGTLMDLALHLLQRRDTEWNRWEELAEQAAASGC